MREIEGVVLDRIGYESCERRDMGFSHRKGRGEGSRRKKLRRGRGGGRGEGSTWHSFLPRRPQNPSKTRTRIR